MLRSVMLAAVVLLAGCQTAEAPEPDPDGPPGLGVSPTVQAGDETPVPPAPLGAGTLNMTACQGLIAGFSWPDALAPGRPPGDWPPGGGPGSDTIVQAFHCDRAGIDGLDRPLNFVFEFHTDVAPPEGCIDDDADYLAVLQSAWVSDREVGAILRDVHRLPVLLANITVTVAADPTGVVIGAAWQNGSYLPSRAESRQVDTLDSTLVLVTQAFWEADGMMHSMLLREESTYGTVPSAIVSGEMHPPMLNSALGTPTFVGRGEAVPSASFLADFSTLDADQCA